MLPVVAAAAVAAAASVVAGLGLELHLLLLGFFFPRRRKTNVRSDCQKLQRSSAYFQYPSMSARVEKKPPTSPLFVVGSLLLIFLRRPRVLLICVERFSLRARFQSGVITFSLEKWLLDGLGALGGLGGLHRLSSLTSLSRLSSTQSTRGGKWEKK